MNRRSLLLLLCLLAALGGVNLWAASAMESSRQSAIDAERDAIQCRQLTDDIHRLKTRPTIAGSHEIELTELSKQIEQAAFKAGIAPSSLIRISPESARRLDSGQSIEGYGAAASIYQEVPTEVLLSGVTLSQMASFLYTMSTGNSAMDVRSIRVTAPREEETSDRWTAEVTLSYLIYAPRNESSLGQESTR